MAGWISWPGAKLINGYQKLIVPRCLSNQINQIQMLCCLSYSYLGTSHNSLCTNRTCSCRFNGIGKEQPWVFVYLFHGVHAWYYTYVDFLFLISPTMSRSRWSIWWRPNISLKGFAFICRSLWSLSKEATSWYDRIIVRRRRRRKKKCVVRGVGHCRGGKETLTWTISCFFHPGRTRAPIMSHGSSPCRAPALPLIPFNGCASSSSRLVHNGRCTPPLIAFSWSLF